MNSKRISRRATNLFHKLFYADKWNIGYIKQSVEDFIKNKKLTNEITWLKEDHADYCADPFVLVHNNNTYIYYEHLNHWNGLGKIYHISDYNFNTKKEVAGLEPDIHLSYPYLFEEDSKVYCIPETARANEIAIYELDLNNLSVFTKKKVLLSGISCVDSSLIKYQGKYWLFTNQRNCKDLLIFHSDSLFGAYTPHKMNPVPCNYKNWRGGGQLFIQDDVLYRPTQNSEIRYGASLIINKITKLTEDDFKSEYFFELHPDHPYRLGLHNISFTKDTIVIDGKKSSFSILMPLKLALRYYRIWKIKKKSAYKLKKELILHSSLQAMILLG